MTKKTLITGAVVFDGTSFAGAQDVLVSDGRVAEILPAGTGAAGHPDAEVVDATGQTLTPGIIDCHVHVTSETAGSLDSFHEPFTYQFYRSVDLLKKTLHGGVTYARDAGGADAGCRLALQKGLIVGPKLKLAIQIMSQTGGHGDGWLPSGVHGTMSLPHYGRPDGVADGVEGVRKKAREILRAGADHIKICSTGGVLSAADDPRHSQFTRDEIAVIVDEAQAQGGYVMAHAQGSEGIKNALVSGVRSIEHGIYLTDELIELFLAKDAYLVPTLQAPLAVIKGAESGAPIPPALVEKAKMVAEVHAESVRRAYAAGVKIAMGTDAGVGEHGQNLEELELLQSQAGMSTADVLAAGTSVAAELMDIGDVVGAIAPGLAADLVLFDGDLESVGVTEARRRVVGVFQDGVRMR